MSRHVVVKGDIVIVLLDFSEFGSGDAEMLLAGKTRLVVVDHSFPQNIRRNDEQQV